MVDNSSFDGITEENPGYLELWLYVAGKTPVYFKTLANLKKLCKEYLKDRCRIMVIGLREHPEFEKDEDIFALPALIKKIRERVK